MVDKKEEKEKPNKLRQNLLCRLSAFNRIVPSVSIVATGNHFSNAKNGWKCIESRANKTKRVVTLEYVCASGCFRICLTQCNFTQNKANYFSNTIGVYHFLLQHLFFFCWFICGDRTADGISFCAVMDTCESQRHSGTGGKVCERLNDNYDTALWGDVLSREIGIRGRCKDISWRDKKRTQKQNMQWISENG